MSYRWWLRTERIFMLRSFPDSFILRVVDVPYQRQIKMPASIFTFASRQGAMDLHPWRVFIQRFRVDGVHDLVPLAGSRARVLPCSPLRPCRPQQLSVLSVRSQCTVPSRGTRRGSQQLLVTRTRHPGRVDPVLFELAGRIVFSTAKDSRRDGRSSGIRRRFGSFAEQLPAVVSIQSGLVSMGQQMIHQPVKFQQDCHRLELLNVTHRQGSDIRKRVKQQVIEDDFKELRARAERVASRSLPREHPKLRVGGCWNGELAAGHMHFH
jgi:hypothetical protein